MRKLYILTVLMALGASVHAQPVIRTDHPRIFFNSETWPQIKERAYGEKREYLDKLIEEVNQMTDDPVAANYGPIPEQDRSLPIPAVKEFGRQAASCALAWRFTGKEKYLEKAKKMLKVSVNAYTEATKNIRPVTWYAHTRINAICAYDWIYEALTDEERRELIVPLVEHVEQIQPEYGLNIPRNSAGDINTGFYGTRSMLWYSGLAAHGDGFCDSLAAKHLSTGYDWYRKVLQFRNDTAGDDGALSSAVPAYAMGNYCYAQFNFMHTMNSSAGINVANDYPMLPLYANWIWWLWIRDTDRPVSLRHAGVGDSYHNTNLMSSIPLYEQLSQFMQFYKDLDPECYGMTAALREFSRHTQLRSHVYPILPFVIDTDHPSKPYYLDVLKNSTLRARHFETLGQFYMRSAFAPDATYCSFTAGASLVQHKHFDENNFTIYKYDHLALDTGDRCKETDYNLVYYYSQSVAHNVVLVHKPDEPLPYHWGIKIENDTQANTNYGGMVKMSGAEVKAFETNDRFTYIASDATKCYGEKCTEAVRQFVFLYPDYVIVYDRMDSSDPSYRKEWLLHTKNKPVVKKGLMRADSNDGRLFCQTLLPADAKFEVVGGKGKEFMVGDRNYPMEEGYVSENEKDAVRRARGPYWGAWRMEVEPSTPRKDDRFLHVLTAASVDAFKPVDAKYVSEENRDGVKVKVDGHEIIFWFNRTGEIGGEVVYDGEACPLTDEVQPQSGFIY